jgi:hypothetical protein
MQAQRGPDGGADPLEEDEPDLYSPRLLLPLITGVAVVLAGVALLGAGADRPLALVELLDAGVLLVVLGVVVFFLIGFWLIPGSLILGGVAFLAAFELESHVPRFGDGGGVLLVVVGAFAVGKAAVEIRRWLATRPR